MKNLLYCLALLLLSAHCLYGAEVRALASPDNVIVGEEVQLIIAAAARDFPRVVNLPKVENVEWLHGSSAMQSSIVNGVAESRASYRFRVMKAGAVEIPPLKVMVGGRQEVTNRVTVTAVAGAQQVVAGNDPSATGEGTALKNLIYGKGRLPAARKEFYVGEEIPVELDIYVHEGLRYQFTSWPEFNLDKVVFRDYSGVNKENSRFDLPSIERRIVGGQRFQVYKLRTAFRAIAAGTLTPSATQSCEISVPDRQRRDFDEDDFFSIMRVRSSRKIPYSMVIDFPELKIKALPPAPEDVEDLGLVGNWLVNYAISAKELKAGEPFTFKIELSGSGTLENLRAPALSIPGLRIYPPEIDKPAGGGRQHAEIRYVMIPLKPGQVEIDLKTAVFSTASERYQIHNYERKFKVTPSESQALAAAPIVVNPSAAPAGRPGPGVKAAAPPVVKSGILYLKKAEAGGVDVPLYLNYLWAYALLLAAGPLAWLVSEWRHAARLRLEADPALRRRLNARTRRRRVLRALKKCAPDKIDDVISQDAAPFLNDLLALPPGTTVTELAEKVNDRELAACLHSSGAASYMPGGAGMDKNELKKRICKALKTFAAAILLAWLPAGAWGGAASTTGPALTDSAALTAYDRGEFERAAEYYRAKIVQEKPDPALLYNLGNCYCQMRNYPAALVCYERARLLAPGDSDIVENLNYVRRKLFQPPDGEIRDPATLITALRDNLRPDQWLLVTAIAWAAGGGILAFRRSLSFNKLVILLSVAGLTALLTVAAAVTQQQGDYSPTLAVIMADNAKLLSLPSETSGQVEAKLQSGAKVKIIESRQDWSRVRSNEAEGWIKSGQMLGAAPGARLPELP